MASSGGNTPSSGGSNLREETNQRKIKRMLSNRESARRSRLRKQKHLNDLTTQLSQLRNENDRVMYCINMITQHYMSLEAENLVLGAQVTELGHRLRSLNEIITCLEQPIDDGSWFPGEQYSGLGGGNDSVSHLYVCQPIRASIDMIM
ncbi:hypothetical protein R6Q59_019296 [Mikania micrantha]|uniref:BZIP domain-containing protein n=1 Tax=Mikania micrantha TaxID=192012 RepID=A0A5N6LY25_9ASTR|nr:hypothetical protein E3N88_34358 [Mikania micrantha]